MEGFQRVKVIGKGAFGAAILVKRGGNNYVIKEVMMDGLSSKEKLEAQNEAKLLRQLDHPYIVKYVDSGVQHGKLWIAMEYCSGGDLDEHLAAKRKSSVFLTEPEALGIFAQVALALSYIHDKHILHRDLKSKNIFLSVPAQTGKVCVVKLGDFGIAKVLANTRDKAKTQIGTPYYLSPEICEDKPYGTKSDVWAMGCILYELLALKVPFTAKDLSGLVRKIMHDPTPALPGQYRSVEGLSRLFESMMRKDFSKRPSIADVLREPCVARAVQLLPIIPGAAAGGADGGGVAAAPATAPVAAAPIPVSVPVPAQPSSAMAGAGRAPSVGAAKPLARVPSVDAGAKVAPRPSAPAGYGGGGGGGGVGGGGGGGIGSAASPPKRVAEVSPQKAAPASVSPSRGAAAPAAGGTPVRVVRGPPPSVMPSHPGRNVASRPQDNAKQQLEEWRAKYREDLERQMGQMPPAPAPAAPAQSHVNYINNPTAPAAPAPSGMGRKVSDPMAVNEFVVRQQEARRNAQRYKAEYDLGPLPERLASPPNPSRDQHGRLPDIGAPPSRADNLSDSRKLAAARQDYFERQQAARRNASKVYDDDMDVPSVPVSARGGGGPGADMMDRAQAVRAQRDKERERERMQQEAKLAAARRQAFEERAALAKKKTDDPAPVVPSSSMESTIVLSRGPAVNFVSQVDRVKEQRMSAKEQERQARERDLAEARRIAFEERQALKARIDRELQQDSVVA